MSSLTRIASLFFVMFTAFCHAGNVELSSQIMNVPTDFSHINEEIIISAFTQALAHYDGLAPVTVLDVMDALENAYQDQVSRLSSKERARHQCIYACKSCKDATLESARVCLCDVICDKGHLCCAAGIIGAGFAAGGASAPCVFFSPKLLALASAKSGPLPSALVTSGLLFGSVARLCDWFFSSSAVENSASNELRAEQFMMTLLGERCAMNPNFNARLSVIVQNSHERMSDTLKNALMLAGITINSVKVDTALSINFRTDSRRDFGFDSFRGERE